MPFKVVSVKEFTYRAKAEQWSNAYLFDGEPPADPATWDALFDAVWAAEQPCVPSSTARARAYGYTGMGPPSVRGKTFDVALAANKGTLTIPASANPPSGDVAVVVRFRVGQNAKGRPRYVMKYLHGVYTTGGDTVPTACVTSITTGMTKLRDGTLPAGRKLCAPDGTAAGVPEVKPYFTTRTLKRRGKRPSRA